MKYVYIIFLFFLLINNIKALDNNLAKKVDGNIKASLELFKENKPEEAKDLLKKSIQIAPDYYAPYYELGKYYYNQALYKLSAIQLEKAKIKLAEHFNEKQFLTQFKAILIMLGDSYLELEKYNKSLSVFTDLLTDYPDDITALKKIAWNYYKINDFNKSEDYIERCLKKNIYESDCLNIKGILYLEKKLYKKSLEQYQKAYGLHSDTINHNIAKVYLSLFNYGKAIYHLKKIVFAQNRLISALSYMQLASIYMNSLQLSKAKKILSQYEKSRADLAKLINLTKTNDIGFIYLSQAKLYYYLGDFHEALKYAQLALDYPLNYGSMTNKKEDFLHQCHFSLSLIYKSLSNFEDERLCKNFIESLSSYYSGLEYQAKSWWHLRKAIDIFISNTKNLKELYYSDLDSMLDYVHLGKIVKELDSEKIKSKLDCFSGKIQCNENDKRKKAKAFYALYLGEYAFYNNNNKKAIELLNYAVKHFNDNEKSYSLRAWDILSQIYTDSKNTSQTIQYYNKIYQLHKPGLRIIGKKLPVLIDCERNSITDRALDYLEIKRFQLFDKIESKDLIQHIKYKIKLNWNANSSSLSLSLIQLKENISLSETETIIENEKEDLKNAVEDFANTCFSY